MQMCTEVVDIFLPMLGYICLPHPLIVTYHCWNCFCRLGVLIFAKKNVFNIFYFCSTENENDHIHTISSKQKLICYTAVAWHFLLYLMCCVYSSVQSCIQHATSICIIKQLYCLFYLYDLEQTMFSRDYSGLC